MKNEVFGEQSLLYIYSQFKWAELWDMVCDIRVFLNYKSMINKFKHPTSTYVLSQDTLSFALSKLAVKQLKRLLNIKASELHKHS